MFVIVIVCVCVCMCVCKCVCVCEGLVLNHYHTVFCSPLDTYIACIRVAMDSSGSCSEQAIAWQTELSRRILWVEYGMPNIPCWGNNFSEIIGTDDIYGLFGKYEKISMIST